MPTPEHMLPSVESADTGPDAGPDTQVGGLHLAEIAAQFSGLLVSTPFDPVWGHASQNNANRDAELEPALLLDHAGFAVVRPAPELACVRCVARHALDNTVDPSGHVVAKHVRKTGFVYPFGTASLGLVPVLLKAIDVGHLARVDVRAGTVTYAPILVHPTCSCAMAPEPGPLEPVVTGPDLRAGEPAAPEPSAYASLVHKERLTFDPAGSITCLTHSYRSSGRVEDVCGGRALSVAAAKRSARCEAVERHHVVHVTRPLHRASFAALAEPALDPEALHVHRPFAPAGSPQYHADLPLRWAAGWSLTQDRKTWVPAQEVWFETLALPDEPALVQPTTSGCAVGSSLTEAVLHALIELIERDAFLAAWYARRPVREIPISALDDAGFQALLQRAQAAHPAHTFRFLDVTSEVGLPAVWA
ncbi:MAG: YcaO-like family protein, partial [Bacteroidota bacterium]